MLSEEKATQFRIALREHCAAAAGSQARMQVAVDDAAAEARDKGLSAEQFVIWVKKICDEIMNEGRLAHRLNPTHLRDGVISSAIKAYYVQ